ncbi:MAG: Prophage integrase IntA [Gammaproteobacteria bacterium]|nr:Prophage integrase IntA [Gammaproteobacteria bacterium]
MLTDIALKRLKPREKPYKVTDRDGMYVTVSPAGTITFRFDYRISNRRETLTLGRYGPAGLSLSAAREKCIAARNTLAQGHSPARVKQREKRQLAAAQTLGQFATKWLDEGPMAESTRTMRKGIYRREVEPELSNRLLPEVSSDDVRILCLKIKNRGSPATAIHVRDIVKGIYNFANLHGHKVPNPANEVAPTSIATFKPRERALSPEEIRIAFTLIDKVSFAHIHRLALRMILLTLVRKSELAKAMWSEVDFDKGVWTIPKERMKARRPHSVYLSRQALEIFTALKLMAGSSPYVFPSRYDADVHIAASRLNRVTSQIAEKAKAKGPPLEMFTVHDLRRTGSTILNEMGFNRDWIEKALAHERNESSRGTYNRAQYAEQRRHMLQEWAEMIDAWVAGKAHTPVLLPSSMKVIASQALT